MVMDERKSDTGREAPRDMPRIIVAQRVIDKIRMGALLYPEPETGEALIGFVVPVQGRPEPDIYILDTIGPGNDAVREWGMFEQGDDWQGDVFDWLYYNWEAFRELRRSSYGNALAAKWDVPLAHVGDWHKQPGDMIAPSGGDAETARRMIEDPDTPVQHLVAPIVTLYPLRPEPPAAEQPAPEAAEAAEATESPEQAPAEGEPVPSEEVGRMAAHSGSTPPAEETAAQAEPAAEPTPQTPAVEKPADAAPEERDLFPEPPMAPNAIVLRDYEAGWTIRADFWYMNKRRKKFVPVVPEVWANDRLPGLPIIGWHLARPRRFEQELGLLRDAGYSVDVVRFDADGHPPYEICFQVYKPGATRVLLVVTSANYPYDMPALRVAPLVSVAEDEDVFEKLYQASRPLLLTELPAWEWDTKRTLLELVRHVDESQKTAGAPNAPDATAKGSAS